MTRNEGLMYQALYRSFRPETFDTLLGQEHIEKILKNQLATSTTGHAYLFCGTRGTGKTTTARLLAKALNCTAESGEKPCGICPNCKAIAEGHPRAARDRVFPAHPGQI